MERKIFEQETMKIEKNLVYLKANRRRKVLSLYYC